MREPSGKGCPKPHLILISASNLQKVSAQLNSNKWEIFNLCRPGFRISEEGVTELTSQIEDLKDAITLENRMVILPL